MSKMNILLIAGHGGQPYDTGATGCGKLEADLNRECTARVAERLKKYANVYTYPTERNAFRDCQSGVFASVLAKTFVGVKFAYAFERHFNAYNKKAYGSECFVVYAEKGITVEQTVMKAMSKYFKLRDNDEVFDGVKRSDFLVINTLKSMGISAALLETCFIDNIDDMDVWTAYKSDIDRDVADAIAAGFGLAIIQPAPVKPEAQKKTAEDIADEIWKGIGNWGTGATRVSRLKNAGYDPEEVQAIINVKYRQASLPQYKVVTDAVVRDVINGKYGNGSARVTALKNAGYDPVEVQKAVNNKLAK